MSDAKRRANRKWNDANMKLKYDRISVLVPKGRKADIEAYAKTHNQSVNGLINDFWRGALGMTEEEWKALDET